jgi:hypothetical protein
MVGSVVLLTARTQALLYDAVLRSRSVPGSNIVAMVIAFLLNQGMKRRACGVQSF